MLPVASCVRPRAERPLDSIQPFAQLESLLPELMARADVPGASIACVQEGRIVWSQAFGLRDSSSKTEADHSTLFEAASVSKTVFAYIALKLCETGVIGLDIPLFRYTPKPFVKNDPRLDKITARRVLSHSAGLAEWRSSDAPLIRYEPGTRFEYSGEGYYYLQSVITQITGKVDPTQCAVYEADFEVCATDFDDFMKRNLLRPFGMQSSTYLVGSGWNHRLARGHDTGGRPIVKPWPRGSDVARYGAVGGLNTTASDYGKFLIEIVSPKKPSAFRLGRPMLAEMVRPNVTLPKDGQIDGCTAWGLGWGIQERERGNLLVHSGGQSGFRSLALASVERRSGLIILTNSDNGGKVIFHPRFLELAGQIVLGEQTAVARR
jgi:CubicO group peptidase (beta-lactamase class C family)